MTKTDLAIEIYLNAIKIGALNGVSINQLKQKSKELAEAALKAAEILLEKNSPEDDLKPERVIAVPIPEFTTGDAVLILSEQKNGYVSKTNYSLDEQRWIYSVLFYVQGMEREDEFEGLYADDLKLLNI